MMMKKLLLAPLLSLALTAPAWAEPIKLASLSRYFADMVSASSPFTQINDDGSSATGTIYIRRPGRARFEYDPPNSGLVIVGGSEIAIFDSKSNVTPEQYPLRLTPLYQILKKNVDLERSNMIVAHFEDGDATVITVRDPKHPDYGDIELKFTPDPVQLREWVITNDVGQQTAVILDQLQDNGQIAGIKFSIAHEITSRGY